jgi:hypothetical protein
MERCDGAGIINSLSIANQKQTISAGQQSGLFRVTQTIASIKTGAKEDNHPRGGCENINHFMAKYVNDIR